MKTLILTGGIKGCGLMIHKGELLNYSAPKSFGKSAKDIFVDGKDMVSEKVGSGMMKKKSIKPLKYKF